MSNLLTEYQINFWNRILNPALIATFQMVFFTTIIASILGFLVAIILTSTSKDGVRPNRFIYGFLNFWVNAIRSFPFLILMVFLQPLTKSIMGTSIGVKAAVVPLVISATAFIAKLIENSFKEVDAGLVEAMKSFGLRDRDIIFRVMISEALPSIISGIIVAMVAILGSTAAAGAIGAGGVGNIALVYGYQKFNEPVMLLCSIILLIFVQVIEKTGKWIYKKMK